MIDKKKTALNGICSYFTMFPLDFPYTILQTHAQVGEWVLDPFCGRGTTNYAGRLLGLPSSGIDSNPVAAALSQAKLVNTTPDAIIQEAYALLDEVSTPNAVPTGEFWEWAFHVEVLITLCRLREGLLRQCNNDARKALRAILMGALHGPQTKMRPSYFSNQSQRTYAPKPRYAVNFWKARNLYPQRVDVLSVIQARAERFYAQEETVGYGEIIQGDSRNGEIYTHLSQGHHYQWVITSPPYYGMRTYLPDQWLRLWLVGGSDTVDYSQTGQLEHGSPHAFAAQLRLIWQYVGQVCTPDARLVIRFGSINDRKVNALELLRQSLQGSGWSVQHIEPAGSASQGHRQALHFAHRQKSALEEYDVWAVKDQY